MPTYEYGCSNCGTEWEHEQKMSDDPITKCPVCGKQTAKRFISLSGGFTLKGGGWAADRYGSTKPR